MVRFCSFWTKKKNGPLQNWTLKQYSKSVDNKWSTKLNCTLILASRGKMWAQPDQITDNSGYTFFFIFYQNSGHTWRVSFGHKLEKPVRRHSSQLLLEIKTHGQAPGIVWKANQAEKREYNETDGLIPQSKEQEAGLFCRIIVQHLSRAKWRGFDCEWRGHLYSLVGDEKHPIAVVMSFKPSNTKPNLAMQWKL